MSSFVQETQRNIREYCELAKQREKAKAELDEAQERLAQSTARHEKAKAEHKKAKSELIVTIHGELILGLMARMTIQHFQKEPSLKATPEEIESAKGFIKDNFLFDQIEKSYIEKKFEVVAAKRCLKLTQKGINDFVIPILNSDKLPKNKQVRSDFGGFYDEIEFPGLIDVLNKVPRLQLMQLRWTLTDEQIDKLATAIKMAGKSESLIQFYDPAQTERFKKEFSKNTTAISSCAQKSIPTSAPIEVKTRKAEGPVSVSPHSKPLPPPLKKPLPGLPMQKQV